METLVDLLINKKYWKLDREIIMDFSVDKEKSPVLYGD